MFENALYYPTIDISNDAWLKTAALFLDRIETIVPESEDRPYQKMNTRMLQDEGILFAHRINPFCEEVRGIEEDVLKFVDTPEGKKSFTRPWGYSRAKGRHGEVMTQDERWMANWKVMNAGKMKQERVEKFKKLLEMMEECKRVNQYQ